MLYKQPNSPYWSYKFNWSGRTIRKSTRQANKRVAEQMEAACRAGLSEGRGWDFGEKAHSNIQGVL